MSSIASRYAAWVDRRRWVILATSLALACGALALAVQLPLRSDFATLLPPRSASVVQLRTIQKRARAFGTIFVVVQAQDPDIRERASKALYRRLQQIHETLLANVAYDDSPKLQYFWDNRFLFADLDALIEARDTLEESIREAKLKANPLFVDLSDDDDDDDDDDDGDSDGDGEQSLDDRVSKLRQQLDDAEQKLQGEGDYVSKDGTLQLLILRSTAQSSNIRMGKRLVAEVKRAIADVKADFPAGSVQFGPTGNIISNIAEHRAIVQGMALAAIITVILCAIALFWFYRSFAPVAMSLWSLTVGVITTFAVAKLTVGHLNVITAFLAAIVIGNGVNAGLVLLARYQEEMHSDRSRVEILAAAIAGAARGTLAASLAAGVAYGSLVITEFRGFQHFGIIGSIGMLLCWLSAFSVLPAGLCVLHRTNRIRPQPDGGSGLGRALVRALPRNNKVVVVVGAVLIVVSAAVSWHYVVSDPMENDWKRLRSDSSLSEESEHWYRMVMHRFKRDFRAGISGRFAIALNERAQVPDVIAMMREHDRDKPPQQRLLAQIVAMSDLLPHDQEEKLKVLARIRELLADNGIADLDDKDRELIEQLTPPDDLRALTEADIPEELSWPFIEKDGTSGRIILATSAPRFDAWIVSHRVEFAAGVRRLSWPEGALIGGQAFVVADIIAAMKEDGFKATVLAVIGAIFMVWLVVGRGRHGAITLISGIAGMLCMIALLDVFAVKINFLDFVAVPITIGIGIDYSVNIAVRERQEGHKGTRHVLSTIGASVVLCSYTTIVGYGSLLLSDNAGIRSFGEAAILGEFACILMAVLLTPALLSMLRRS